MPALTQNEINRLSPAERLELIAELWDSISDDEVALTPAQQTEIARRLNSFDADRETAVAWTDLKSDLAKRAP